MCFITKKIRFSKLTIKSYVCVWVGHAGNRQDTHSNGSKQTDVVLYCLSKHIQVFLDLRREKIVDKPKTCIQQLYIIALKLID